MTKFILIAISIFSSILFFITILFEGKLKKDSKSATFFSEFKKLNIIGWIVILIVISINLVETHMSIKNIEDDKEQYKQDTTRLFELNEELRDQKEMLERQRITDSLTIDELKIIAELNLHKTDSINRNIILTAANESKRQLSIIDKSNQNKYDHFKAEIESNYYTLINGFDSTHLRGFIDTTLFIYAKFDNKYINEYTYISTNPTIINNLLTISKAIDKINSYCISSTGIKGNTKRMNIETIIRNVKNLKNDLLFEYLFVKQTSKYKDYESKRNEKEYFVLNIDSLDNTIRVKK